MEYLLHIAIMICIYVILSVSLDLIAGYCGLLSVAHAAFYGIGAYTTAMMALYLHTPFLVNMFTSIILTAALGFIVGLPSLRIRDDYFVIATFALQVIAYTILNSWVSFTGGPSGLPGIPQPSLLGFPITTSVDFLLLVCLIAAFQVWLSMRIVNSPFGRVLMAIREDEMLARAFGKNVDIYKLFIFMTSASMAGTAGVIYAYYISFIDPTSFTVMESVFIISIVIIGGTGSIWGSVLGSVILVCLPEFLRFIGLPNSIGAYIRQILYGLLLVSFLLWRPRGFLGQFTYCSRDSISE